MRSGRAHRAPAARPYGALHRSVRSGAISRVGAYVFATAPPGEARMDRPMTFKEIAKITAGAVVSLVIVGWLMVLAIAFLTVL